ncbi:DUF1837 domain-containing protein [Leucobacter coleopterorum]|uniref:DUF1837 domain-containing protein n=1 Tax=Leucobacter coleopterorum TaxID=2714933 RepID=A0ABX6K0B2_9MICO|nr:DUF1837 domain-containing protein [Leucobacter coleopterorum]QIM18667.1 DUF1837 domain-containing protein [Leucobacter coleopterorum]
MTESPEPLLTPSLLEANLGRFNALFCEPLSAALQAKTNLHLHILQVQNGDFDLPGLYRELKGNSVAYVLSRLNYQKVLDDPSLMMEVASKVQSQFRKPEKNSGEGGEVILYSLLEGSLGAPKVLSKMELKTSSQHYVHGSDGVHLLRVDDNNYQLIFGESKMYGDAGTTGSSVKRGIKAAFESIGDVHSEGFDFDTWLVQSELLKEQLNETRLEALAAILLPSSGGANGIKKHNAFGIFVGYEIDVTDLKVEEMQLDDIEAELIQRATEALEAEHDLIRSEISNRGLGIYPIHIYAVPFAKRGTGDDASGIEKVRFDLAAQLGNYRVLKK